MRLLVWALAWAARGGAYQNPRKGLGGDAIPVVMASDVDCLPGLIVAISSIYNSTASPERVQVHVVSTLADAPIVRSIVACALPGLVSRVRVIPFEAPDDLPLSRRRRAHAAQHRRLLVPLNYARFFISWILEDAWAKVVYLDVDVVVTGDVADLYDSALVGGGAGSPALPVAAVPRAAGQKLRLAQSVGTNAAARAALIRRGVAVNATDRKRPSTFLDDFNAGVVVIDLERWTALNLTDATLDWMALNAKHDIYTKGSNPPLVLALRDRFERVDQRWNCPARPRGTPLHEDCANPGILHLTGFRKPWLDAGDRDRRWLAAAPPRLGNCLFFYRSRLPWSGLLPARYEGPPRWGRRRDKA